MSGLSASRYALAGLLLAAAPAAAQDTPPAVPKPPAHQNRIEIELRFGALNGTLQRGALLAGVPGDAVALPHTLNFEALRAVLGRPAVAPMPRLCPPGLTLLQFQTLRDDVFQPAVPPQPAPFVIAPTCPAPPVRRAPNDSMKLMASDAFGQLLQQSGVTSPPPFTVTLESVAAKPGIVGTWHRERGTARCTIKIDGDHMTMTLSQSGERGSKVIQTHLTLTADYHIARDGHTAVGLITSVDAKIDGGTDEDATDAMERIADFQKVMEEKPFAMTCRRYGDALVIGNVRLPGTDASLIPLIGGRYASGESKAATKTAKACTPGLFGMTTLPEYTPYQAFQPAPPLDVMPSPVVPAGGFVPSIAPMLVPRSEVCPPAALGSVLPRCVGAFEASVPSTPAPLPLPPLPQMPEPVKPIPQMPQPTPPTGFVPRELDGTTGARTNNAWRRFWFNDQPSHLTPERVHGGIY